MSDRRTSRWFRHSAHEQEPQTFPVDQGPEINPEEEVENPTASYHPVAEDPASHLSSLESLLSTQAAAVPVQIVQNDSDPAMPIDLDYLARSVEIPGIPGMLLRDCQDLAQRREVAAPPPRPTLAEQVAGSRQFQRWLERPDSSGLLIHGGIEPPADIFGLSQFCMSFAHVLEKDPRRFIPLVFCCGLHTRPSSNDCGQLAGYNENDQPRYGHSELPRIPDTGGRAIFMSLIHQLLHKLPDFGCTAIDATSQELHEIQSGDLEALKTLFGRLVHTVPEGVAVCCLVDGVEYYERNEFWNDSEFALMQICLLADLRETRASFKVLFTTPTHTRDVKEWFPEERVLGMKWMNRGDTKAGNLESVVEKGGPYSNERRQRLLYLGVEFE